MAFPLKVCQKLRADPARKGRLELWLERRFELNSDFSGMLCFEDSFRWHLVALASWLKKDIPSMYSYKTCDTDPVTHQVMSSRTILKPAIILNNIMDRIPPEKLAFLQDLAVSEELPSEHVEDSHMEMFNALLRDSPGFFPIHAQGIDLMTGQKRYVYSPCQRDRDQAKSSTASNDAAASSSHKGSCHKTCVASGAGTPCLPFSRRNTAGKHKGLAHCSIPSTCSWVAERKARAETEDLNFHECVTGFPEHTLLHNPLSLTHECKSISCSVDGWCTPRPRLNTVMYTNKYVWMGSKDHKQEFKAMFEGAATDDPSIFMVDSRDNIQVEKLLRQTEMLLATFTCPIYFAKHCMSRIRLRAISF